MYTLMFRHLYVIIINIYMYTHPYTSRCIYTTRMYIYEYSGFVLLGPISFYCKILQKKKKNNNLVRKKFWGNKIPWLNDHKKKRKTKITYNIFI